MSENNAKCAICGEGTPITGHILMYKPDCMCCVCDNCRKLVVDQWINRKCKELEYERITGVFMLILRFLSVENI